MGQRSVKVAGLESGERDVLTHACYTLTSIYSLLNVESKVSSVVSGSNLVPLYDVRLITLCRGKCSFKYR